MPASAPFGHCPKCLIDLGFGPLPDDLSSAETSDGKQRFGDYELVEQLGRGGMGVVYKARQIRLNRLVALKMISAGEFASSTLIQRFHREAEAAANLHHPNIVPIYEIGELRGQHFYSMQLVEGTGLDKHISRSGFTRGPASADARTGPLARQEDIARILATVARAVDYAHRHGVLHRDLKPGNILLDARGEPHLTDFGVAKVLGHEASNLTASGAIMGTPSFMASEQAAGDSKHITVAADIYSLGAVLYTMLTGSPPFRAETPVETLKQVIEQEPKHPSTIREGLDFDLATIAMKCLEKEPQRRYASAVALAEDLERWLHGEPIQARPVHNAERFWRWCRRNPKEALLGGSVAFLLLCLTIGAMTFAARVTRLNRSLEDTATAKHYALDVMQRNVIRSLEEMWVSSNQDYETISSEMLAALRGEQSRGNPGGTNQLNLLFAVYTHEKPTVMLSNMAPVLAVLEGSMVRSLSQPVQIHLRIYRQYDAAKAALVRGAVDFARFGSASYVEAKKLNPGVTLLLAQNGKIRGYIFTRADSGIESLSDLRGKSMGFVDDSSTTGHYLPKQVLLHAGIMAKDLNGGGTNYLGSHDSVVAAVARGKVQAGACNASIVDQLMKDTGVKFRVLHEIRETKGLPWMARPMLSTNVAAAIRTGLRSITDAAIFARLRNDTTGFEDAEDEDYDSIRDAMEGIGRFEGRVSE